MVDPNMGDNEMLDLSGSGRQRAEEEKGVPGGRKSFRFPMSGRHEVRAVVDGEPFPLLDLGSHGIAIQLDDADRFVRGETIAHVVLIIGDDKIETKGKVVHITRTGETIACGIVLKGMNPDAEFRLQAFLQGHREDFFSSGG